MSSQTQLHENKINCSHLNASLSVHPLVSQIQASKTVIFISICIILIRFYVWVKKQDGYSSRVCTNLDFIRQNYQDISINLLKVKGEKLPPLI